MFADRVVIQSGEGHNTQQADDDCSRKPKNPGIGCYWGKAEGESSDYANPLMTTMVTRFRPLISAPGSVEFEESNGFGGVRAAPHLAQQMRPISAVVPH